MEPELTAFSARRKTFESDKAQLAQIVKEGQARARENADKTLTNVKRVMRIIK